MRPPLPYTLHSLHALHYHNPTSIPGATWAKVHDREVAVGVHEESTIEPDLTIHSGKVKTILELQALSFPLFCTYTVSVNTSVSRATVCLQLRHHMIVT